MTYTDDTLKALATLRRYTKYSEVAGPVCEAIDTLDNAGVFRELDEQTDYEEWTENRNAEVGN